MELGCHVVFLLCMRHLQVTYVIYVISVPVCMSHSHMLMKVRSDNGSLYEGCMWYVYVYSIKYIQYMYYKLAL
jgi:hypothetical protein